MRRSPLPPPAALLFVALLAAAGCASSGGPSAEPPRAPSSLRIATAGGRTTTVGTVADGAVRGDISAPLDSAWRVLPGVYASLKIPLTMVDDTAHFLGNEGLRIRRSIGGQPLMRYLDCGSGSGGPNAETFDIRLAIFTQLRPVGSTGSTATTSLQASARNPNFNSPEMACASNGLLEQRINELLQEAVIKAVIK